MRTPDQSAIRSGLVFLVAFRAGTYISHLFTYYHCWLLWNFCSLDRSGEMKKTVTRMVYVEIVYETRSWRSNITFRLSTQCAAMIILTNLLSCPHDSSRDNHIITLDCSLDLRVTKRTTQSVLDWGINRRACVCLFFEICVMVSTWNVLFWKVSGCNVVVSVRDFLFALCLIQLNCCVILRYPPEIEVLRICAGGLRSARAGVEQIRRTPGGS